MYVPGQLSDVDNVLVDIGTGYYVDMVSSFHVCYKNDNHCVLALHTLQCTHICCNLSYCTNPVTACHRGQSVMVTLSVS